MISSPPEHPARPEPELSLLKTCASSGPGARVVRRDPPPTHHFDRCSASQFAWFQATRGSSAPNAPLTQLRGNSWTLRVHHWCGSLRKVRMGLEERLHAPKWAGPMLFPFPTFYFYFFHWERSLRREKEKKLCLKNFAHTSICEVIPP